MKIFAWRFIIPFYLIFSASPGNTQDLSHLFPAAHYTLINTAEDALGLQQPIALTNSPFFGSEGVYSNGYYIGDYPTGSLILTPFLNALYDSVFAVQVEFRITELDDTIRPVMVCGTSYRYLGFLTWPDSTFFVLYNNSNFLQVPESHASEDNWYEITMFHHTPDALTEWYLDGVKVYEINVPLDRNMTDGVISNVNFSMGRTFKGYLRNLRVYGSEEITAIHRITSTIQGLKMFPNPTNANLFVECTDDRITNWRILDNNRVVVLAGEVTPGTTELNTHDLIPGWYVVNFLQNDGKPVGSNKFVKGK